MPGQSESTCIPLAPSDLVIFSLKLPWYVVCLSYYLGHALSGEVLLREQHAALLMPIVAWKLQQGGRLGVNVLFPCVLNILVHISSISTSTVKS